MTESQGNSTLRWEWAVDWPLWACRLSHAVGLVVVLLLLLALGWAP